MGFNFLEFFGVFLEGLLDSCLSWQAFAAFAAASKLFVAALL